jgi:protein O-mannosyl-transferase
MTLLGRVSEPFSRRAGVVAAVSLILTCLALYANSLSNPFLRDDRTALVEDRRARDPLYWKDIFIQRYWHGLNSDPIYRPLTTLSFLVNHMACGDRVWAFRIVNVLIHAAVCLAVYAVGVWLLEDRFTAWLAAMLFAVHAVHSEAVLCVVGRADMMVTLLILIVLAILVRRPLNQGCEPWRVAAIVAITAVAVFFKETAFVLLPLVVAVQLWQRWGLHGPALSHGDRRRVLVSEALVPIGVGLVCLSALLVRFALFGQISRPTIHVPIMDNPLGQAQPVERLLTAAVLLGKYLRLLVWPHPLSCDYSYNQIPVARSLLEGPVLIGLAWLAGLALVLWGVRRYGGAWGWRVAVWCAGFFVITYSLVSNAVLIIGTIFGERLIYLPSVAWIWAMAAGGVALARRTGGYGRWAIGTLFCLYLAVNAGLTVQRNRDWSDPLRLWKQTAQVAPNSSRPWANLSRTLGLLGKRSEAIDPMRRALKINNEYWEDHMVLGDHLAWLGRYAEAAEEHRQACEMADPPFKVRPTFLLGQCYMELKQNEQAIRAFKTVVELDPNHVTALNNLAWMQATVPETRLRDLSAAQGRIEKAMALAPRSLMLADTAVEVYLARGDRERAVRLAREALTWGDSSDPVCTRLREHLGRLTATSTSRATTGTTPRSPAGS